MDNKTETIHFKDPILVGTTEARILALAVLVGVGLMLYGFLTYLFGVFRFTELRAFLRRLPSA